MATGEAFDLVWAGNWSNNYLQGVAKGAYLDITDLMKEYAHQTYAKVPEDYWKAASVDGKLYSSVNYQVVARTGRAAIPKILFDEAPFDINSIKGDVSKLAPYLEVVSKNHPDYLVQMDTQGLGEYFGYEYLVGYNTAGAIDMNTDDLTVFNQFETQAYRDYFDLVRDWNNSGLINGANQIATQDWIEYRKNGMLSIMVGGKMKPGGDIESNKTFAYDCEYVPLSDAYVTTGSIIATVTAVSANSKNPERAIEVIEAINTDVELYNLLCFELKVCILIKFLITRLNLPISSQIIIRVLLG